MEHNDIPSVTPVTSAQTVAGERIRPEGAKDVNDWLRDLRMSASVNRTTVGVESDRVTPELMMAAAAKLLKINRREAEPDAKDSLEFQRVYGPTDFVAEHVLRDGSRLGRQLLWKATNRGNLDWIPTGALDQHVSDVFNNSKMANMVDGSSPLELVEASYKISRIGEGGIGDVSSAPDEMRLVQPSFLGYIDPVRSVESLRVGLDAYMTKNVMKGSDGKLYQTFVNARTGKPELVDSVTAARSVVTTPDMMKAKTDHIYALGGRTGVRIVSKKDVDYYLPHMDDAFTTASNLVTGLSGVKELRLLMGCLHPDTPVFTVSRNSEVTATRAVDVSSGRGVSMPCRLPDGTESCLRVAGTVAKFLPRPNFFVKTVLYSGRVAVTSRNHRWSVRRNGRWMLVEAGALKPGDRVPRSLWKGLPSRRTFLRGRLINADLMTLLGYAARSLSVSESGRLAVSFQPRHRDALLRAMSRLDMDGRYSMYQVSRRWYLALDTGPLSDWLRDRIGVRERERTLPPEVLSAPAALAADFLDAYTADETLVAMDCAQDVWICGLPNRTMRDCIALLLARTGADTLYRDSVRGPGDVQLALKVVEPGDWDGDYVLDEVKSTSPFRNAPVMVDIDLDDSLFALGNGVVTHNSKYPQQAVPITGREAPLVRGIDGPTGRDIHSLIGRYLGARYASRPGTVTAVRKDRIDMLYDDGTRGSVALYVNFPMNAKGYITNTPQVKAGQHVDGGGLLASSNYTTDDGTAATGTNLRTGWMSWKGGTYEDAVVLSESAAKKLTSTTMYATGLDLDRTVTLGKDNFRSWKPEEYTSDQLDKLDANGIVKPGTVLRKGDPMVLAVQATEPSPGTLGKRILTDVSETWDHDHEGLVTDVLRTRHGVKVLTTVTAPVELNDKVSGMYGNKGVVSQIIPDDRMPRDKDGRPLEMLLSPLGLITRTNPAQLHEALLGKVARKTGRFETLPAFYEGNIRQHVMDRLKKYGISPDNDFFDPETGRRIPNIVNGYSYVHKLKHLAESKLSARGTDTYSVDGTPGGSGYASAKRFGALEQSAMAGHSAFANLLDNKLIRGQSNADFWRSIRTGGIPVIPGEPLVQKKFFAHLQGSGVNVRKTPKGISVFSLSNGDVREMTGPRELKSRDTYEARTFRPLNGGLFGQDVFGIDGDRWGYIQLDDPLPNPVMEKPLARLLRMSDRDFVRVASGQGEVDGMRSGADLRGRLERIDLDKEAARALQEFKDARRSERGNALKRYVAVENMRRAGLKPSEYMLDRIPVLPPIYRPISSHGGLTMVSDANYLYAQMLDARDDMREAEGLPEEYRRKAQGNLYRCWQEVTGMYDPEDVKLRNKNVGGLLQWALGKGSPKFSAFQRKVLGGTVDTVGRGAIIPNSRLTIDQIGLPVGMAFDVMAPFVERALVKRGYTPIQAMKMVKRRSPQALDILRDVMRTHPVEMNRAPTLHKFNILAFEPVLVQGHGIQINPSVCPGFGADFDGDTVNVHVPVSDNARREAWDRMRPSRNLMTLSNHKIMNKPEKEYMQGLYIATRMGKAPDGRVRIFRTLKEAREAYRGGEIDVDTPIRILEQAQDADRH